MTKITLCSLWCFLLFSFALQATEKPNILIIVADDLGYNDVSFTDGKSLLKTPNIDRIAHEGVRLDRFYTCPICSPTRVGLMTGRWPHTMGLMRAVIPPWRERGLEPELETLPKILAKHGYPQRAIIGKWHLGHSQEKHLPLHQGFTHFYGHLNGAIDYFTHQRENQNDWHRNHQPIFEEGYATDLLANEAIQIIEKSHHENKPFFIYLPFNAPHSPFQAKDEDLKHFPHLSGDQKTYAAMVKSMDDGIGQILNKLDDLELAQSTFVIFFSDNGGVSKVSAATKIRDGKFSVYEGGIRVCAAARWPDGNVSGKKQIKSQPIGYIDLLPTLCDIAGIKIDHSQLHLDGQSILPVLQGKSEGPERPWFSYIHQSKAKELYSLILGDYKLVVLKSHKGKNPTVKTELYHLKSSPSEKTNIINEHPEKVEEMMKLLNQFQSRQQNPISHYTDGKKSFRAPKDWVIKDKK